METVENYERIPPNNKIQRTIDSTARLATPTLAAPSIAPDIGFYIC